MSAFVDELFAAGQRKWWPELGQRQPPEPNNDAAWYPAEALRQINGDAHDAFWAGADVESEEKQTCREKWTWVIERVKATFISGGEMHTPHGALVACELMLQLGNEVFREGHGRHWWQQMHAQIAAHADKLALMQPKEV
jgi:hypothetical protein